MTKTIIILGLAIAMASCNNPESKMKSAITDYLKKNAKDPKSYELVELKIIDTVIAGEFAKNQIKNNDLTIKEEKENLQLDEKNLNDALVYQKKYGSDFNVNVENAKLSIESSKTIIQESITDSEKYKKNVNSKEVVGYVATHKYRLKNGFGALDLSSDYVEFDKDFKLLHSDKDLDLRVFQID